MRHPNGTHLDWGRVEEGTHRLALPGDGRYVLVASAQGRATRSQFVDVLDGQLPPMQFGERLQLGGTVTRAERACVGVPVTLTKHSGEYHADGATHADGSFSLPLPPPGDMC